MKGKRLKLVILFLSFFCGINVSNGATFDCEGLTCELYASQFDEFGRLAGYARVVAGDTPYKGNIIIPWKVYDLDVNCDYIIINEIASNAFWDCTELTSVNMQGIVNIGDDAFTGCSNLKSVSFHSGLKVIGENAFRDCINLETALVFPEGLTRIKRDAFSGCTKIPSIKIANSSDLVVGPNAFSGCVGLTSVHIPGKPTYSVNTMSAGTFDNCTGLTSITFGDDLTYLPPGMFHGCTGLTSITIPGHIKTIGGDITYHYGVFQKCTNLSSVTIQEGIEVIGTMAFSGCSNLYSIKLPNTLKYIGGGAFESAGLEEIDLGVNLEKIADKSMVYTDDRGAFNYCKNLRKVIIHEKLKYIGSDAFDGCSNLKEVHIDDLSAYCQADKNTSYYRTSPFNNGADLYVDGELVENLVIPNDVAEIKAHSFNGCNSIKSIKFGAKLKSIGYRAFNWCPNLKHVVFPSSLETFDNDVFADCHALEFADLSKTSLTKITNVFWNCSGLKVVNLPLTIKELQHTFFGCSSISELSVPCIMPPVVNTGALLGIDKSKCILTIPEESYDAYMAHSEWSGFLIDKSHLKVEDNYIKNNGGDVEIRFKKNDIMAASVDDNSDTYKSLAYDGSSIYVPTETSLAFRISSDIPFEFGYSGVDKEENKNPEEWESCYEFATPPIVSNETLYIVNLDNTSIEDVFEDSYINVEIEGGNLKVSGLKKGEPFSLYDVNGNMLYHGIEPVISVAIKKGVYVVKCGTETKKVLL